jgi:hypothetical protein
MNLKLKGRDHTTSRLIVLGLIPLISACAIKHIPAATPTRSPRIVPARINDRYQSPDKQSPEVALTFKDQGSGYRHYVGAFNCRSPGQEGSPHKVSFDYYQATVSGKAPVIVCTPILGGKGALERGVAKSFAIEGFHAVLVHRSHRFFKKPIPSQLIERKFRSAIADRRRVIDWLMERPEIDTQRVAAFGISMGGIVTSVLTPLEPRIHSAAICMAGGDIGAVISVSAEKPLVKYREARMAKEQISLDRLREDLRGAIHSDPLYIAPYGDASRFLMFISIYDKIVPTRYQRRLREALGKPETYLIPTGHYTAILFLPLLRRMTIQFFRRRFAKPNPRVLLDSQQAVMKPD